MKFKKRKEPVFTSDTYYDLFDGGYIDPRKMLVDKADADRVVAAIATVRAFLDAAREAGALEEG